jgi:hypothetical protein
MFVYRHRLVAIPGIALCWAFILSRFRPPALRLLFCVALVAVTAYGSFHSPSARRHGVTQKYALQFAQKNASVDHAPVIICSDFVESDFVAMPLESPEKSRFFAPLSYYKVSIPVVPLPKDLNAETIRVASRFIEKASRTHKRFLALADPASYKTLDWLAHSASGSYEVRNLGIFDETKILEFAPRPQMDAQPAAN